jgi:DNA-binding NarL/FixJ family response regulator
MPGAISQPPVTVCTVTENRLVDAYLGQFLSADDRFRAMTRERYYRLLPSRRRDIVFVMDQSSTRVPLAQLLKDLRNDCVNSKFLVVDYEKSNEEILRLLLLGVHGYVAQTRVPKTLTQAILSLAAGQLWVPPEVLHEFLVEVGHILRNETRKRETPTPREEEVLELVRARLSNREIAGMLKIQVSTVKFHVSNIFSKLHAASRRELFDAPFQKIGKRQIKWI